MQATTLVKARRKYSQSELAKILGVSTKTVSRWESGGTVTRSARVGAATDSQPASQIVVAQA